MQARSTTFHSSPVAGYIRSAKLKDPAIDELEKRIRAYAKESSYNLITVFREEGASAVSTYKPVLVQLIASIAKGKFVGVIVPSTQHLGHPPAHARRTILALEHAGAWVTVLSDTR